MIEEDYDRCQTEDEMAFEAEVDAMIAEASEDSIDDDEFVDFEAAYRRMARLRGEATDVEGPEL